MSIFDRLFQTPTHKRLQQRAQTDFSAHSASSLQSSSNHPVIQLAKRMPGYYYMNTGSKQRWQMDLFHALRELLPVVNDAFDARRDLEGDLTITTDDDVLREQLQNFIDRVPVGYVYNANLSKGLNTYVNALADSADEYGVGFGEPEVGRRQIQRLKVPDSRTFFIEVKHGTEEHYLYQTVQGNTQLINGDTLHLLSFEQPESGLWPRSMLWGLDFVGEILIRMLSATNNTWFRTGDPKNVWLLLYDTDPAVQPLTSEQMLAAQTALSTSISAVYEGAKVGKTGDVYHSMAGGTLERKDLNSVETSIMEFLAAHHDLIAAQIWSRADLPSWMMPGIEKTGTGMNSDRYLQEGLAAMDATTRRQRVKSRIAREVLDLFLVLSGQPQDVRRYTVQYEGRSLASEKYLQDARKSRAEADRTFIEVVESLLDDDGKSRFTDPESIEYLQRVGVLHA